MLTATNLNLARNNLEYKLIAINFRGVIFNLSRVTWRVTLFTRLNLFASCFTLTHHLLPAAKPKPKPSPPKPKPSPSKPKCKAGSKAEVVFVLDSSTSVGPKNWKLELKFLTDIVRRLHIGPHADRVGLVTYNTDVKVEFGLTKYTSKAALIRAIHRVKFSEGITATGDALRKARTAVLSQARPGVPKIVILITDGRTNWGANPIKEAAKLKASGATVLAVGITDQVNK